MEDKDFDGLAPSFLVSQARLLENIATGVPLDQTLTRLARVIQEQLPGALCSILLLDAGGSLRVGAAPDLPAEYNALIDGLPIGPQVEANGPEAAVPSRGLVIATDIDIDDNWRAWSDAALRHGLHACGSLPISGSHGEILGTFALYRHEPGGGPSGHELRTVRAAAHLASVALERQELAASQDRSESKWRGVFEHSLDAIFLLDDARRFTDANPAACELLGACLEQLIGAPIGDWVQPAPRHDLPDTTQRWMAFLRDGRDFKECLVYRADGGMRYAAVQSRANFLPGLHLCTARDITDQRLTEEAVRSAERLYRSLVETTGTGYVIADARGRVIDANAEYIHLTGHQTLDEIRGRHPMEWTVPADRERFAVELALCNTFGKLRNLEVEFCHSNGGSVPVEINATLVHTDDEVHLLSLCHDITGRLNTRRELQNASLELESRVERRTAQLARANEHIQSQARQQEAVAELGRRALAGTPPDALMQHAVETVIAILGADRSAVLEHADPESDQLVMRALAGWPDATRGTVVGTTDPALVAGYSLHSHEPVVYDDIATETRFRFPTILLESGVTSGVTVRIDGDPRPFGILSVHNLSPRRFTTDDAHFLRSVANVLAAAVERHRSEEIVRLAQQSAVQANNAKLEFLSRMSHELRTPLNAILGFSQLLEIERLSGGQRESVEQITRAGRHLLELVNEVLDISRIDSGNMSLTPEPLAVDEMLREAIDLIRPLADARRIELIAGPGCLAADHYVLADRQRLRQVLINLLSNAVKYNHPTGKITLDAAPSPNGKHFRLSVCDTGMGISPEKFSRLFTPFERLGAEHTDVEGSGMGLALSKRLVESQRGELGVESVPGSGSTFWVDLPVAAAPAPGTGLEIFNALLDREPFEPEDPILAAVEPLPAPLHTILHIEDNEPNRRLVEMLVAQRPSLRLLTASKGRDGLSLAREHHPDLILLDLHLPDTTGESVLHHLRADAATRDTPVVMVSADAAAVRRNQQHVEGTDFADSYLTKPFNVTQFLQLLDTYFERNAA